VADRPWWRDASWAVRDYVRRVWDNCEEDNVLFLASGIAFNILVAVIPFLLLLITGFTYVLPRLTTADPTAALAAFISGLLPVQTGAETALLTVIMDDVLRTRGRVTIFSAVIFLFLSTRLFGSLRAALAEVFDIEYERGILRGKLFDLQITVVATILFVASQVINTYLLLGTTRGLAVLGGLGLRNDVVGWFEQLVGRLLAFAFIAVMFFALYKFLPVRKVRTRTAWLAALFAALLFEVAKHVFRMVVASLSVQSLYTGTIAALIIVVAWVYYAAVIFLLGGEVGQVYELRRTRRLQTDSSA
jgi:membrane protein